MIKPILFNTDMVRAILDERKTVTRRLVKFLPGENPNWTSYIKDGLMLYTGNNEPCCRRSPYQVGDVMYVREMWSEGYEEGTYIYKADDKLAELPKFKKSSKLIYHPSIHMPKEAARLWLKVTDVRMERLQEITENQIITEGTPYSKEEYAMWKRGDKITCNANTYLRDCFMRLWDSTIKKTDLARYGWAVNPWVWVIKFECSEKPVELNPNNCCNLSCRRKCKKDGYNQALEDIFQLIKSEKEKLGSHLKNEEFMYGWESLEDVIKKLN